MAKEFKITPSRQYNIDTIRRIRLDLGISGTELSLEISSSKNTTFVGSIESAGNNASYTDHMMNQIAIYFTTIAKQRQAELDQLHGNEIKIKTDYTIYDFYPKTPLSEDLQTKVILSIPRDGSPTATLNAILETSDFLNTNRSLKEIVAHCNDIQKQAWQGSDFTATLERAKNKGRIEFIYLNDGTVKYRSKK